MRRERQPLDETRTNSDGSWSLKATAELKKKETGAKYVQSIRRIYHDVVCCRVEHTKLTSSEVRREKYRPRPRCLGGRFGLEGRLRQPCQGWLQSQHCPRAGDVLPG